MSRIVSQFRRFDVFRISTDSNKSVSGITGLDDEQQIEDNVESTTGSENQKAMNCEPVEESEKLEQSQTGDSNRPEGGVLEDEDDDEIMLIAMASNDVASRQIQTDLLTVEERKDKAKSECKGPITGGDNWIL